MNFKDDQIKRAEQIEKIIKTFLPPETGYQKIVIEAMNYSILAGGKRIRPMLMEETYRLLGGTETIYYPFMAALEMIHTYSLVHDDLPAMDNDEYRRGRKTTHIVYGEGFAILSGDGLLNLAFETAAGAFTGIEDPETLKRVAKALQVLGKKAGIYGMIGGQTADIQAEETEQVLTEEMLLFIHEHKTAALIQSAMTIGGILAGAGPEEVAKLEKAAYNIGIAFQIQDDILDVTGTFEELGKPIGSDDKNHKLTYVSLKGVELAKAEVARLSHEAVEILRSLGENEFLFQLVEEMIHRNK